MVMEGGEIGVGKRKYEEVQEEGSGPKVQESQGPRVKRSRGPKDQNISKSHSNTNLTLKKVHLVLFIFYEIIFHVVYKKFI